MIECERRLNRTCVDSSCVNRLIDNDRGNTRVKQAFYITDRKRKFQEGNVFSRVCLQFCLGGEFHVTIAHDSSDLTIQELHLSVPLCKEPPSPLQSCPSSPLQSCPSLSLQSCPSLANDIWWPTQETCWNLFTLGPPPLVLTSAGYWSTYGRSPSGRYASYWNAFLLQLSFTFWAEIDDRLNQHDKTETIDNQYVRVISWTLELCSFKHMLDLWFHFKIATKINISSGKFKTKRRKFNLKN